MPLEAQMASSIASISISVSWRRDNVSGVHVFIRHFLPGCQNADAKANLRVHPSAELLCIRDHNRHAHYDPFACVLQAASPKTGEPRPQNTIFSCSPASRTRVSSETRALPSPTR